MARPPVANPLVFVSDLDAPALVDSDDHHLRRVLRVRDGDEVTVADGAGRWRLARFGRELECVSAVADEGAPTPPITVAFAVVKGDRPEFIVQKLTELGVDRIVPFVATRSVVRWEGERAARHLERLRRVAREAAMQCRRTRLPIIDDVTTFADVIARPRAAIADLDGAPPSLEHPFLVIGPEGGWTTEERAAAPARVGLAAHVLRAETAAIAAATLLTALRGAVVAPSLAARGRRNGLIDLCVHSRSSPNLTWRRNAVTLRDTIQGQVAAAPALLARSAMTGHHECGRWREMMTGARKSGALKDGLR